VRHDIPVTAVVFHNRQWGAEKKNQVDFYNRRFVAGELDNPSFAGIARAMGAEGIVVDKLEDVGPALKKAIDGADEPGKTCVIEIMCDPRTGRPVPPRCAVEAGAVFGEVQGLRLTEAIAQGLENKKHPAQKAADEVRRVSAEKKALRVQLKYLEYAIKTYHEYYPVLEEYSDDILNELATLDLENDDAPDADRVARYISREEYARLSTTQRNQLALDKWKARRKSNVEIGRIYERYLGYLYEQDGWAVTFVGALEGLEDMGRDLLCIRDDEVHVVQAKYWSKHKTIHEKHIFQLYGTSLLVPRTHQELRGRRIVPIFATTTVLSDTALWAAKALDVQIRSIDMDQDYPVIKCNINGDERIYHLPFDQQYDRVRIIPAKGELYVKLVAEAEAKGFRRAKRFYGA
jgi:hypothetical protein